MSEPKTGRATKRQLGQFPTPAALARRLVEDLPLRPTTTVLEPSAGAGAFVLPLIERFIGIHEGTPEERLRKVLTGNVFAVEIDPRAHATLVRAIEERWGPVPDAANVVCGDYFATDFPAPPIGATRGFDLIVGNPPFGGTIDPRLQDPLDRRYGQRDGLKIKKETYAFFIVRSVDMLAPGGSLRFICSDTFLTIPTMKGLREFLLNRGSVRVTTLSGEFAGTSQPMVVLDFILGGRADVLEVDGTALRRATVNLTGNRSWRMTDSIGRLFDGPTVGGAMVATSGMTVGRNDLFVREIVDGAVEEPYEFRFREEPITLAGELARARLGTVTDAMRARILAREARGETRRVVEPVVRPVPLRVELPHPDYCPYNKACRRIVHAPPRHAIFWRDDGDAVITFKKTGNWYLHGVGGRRFFKREGLTWQLIAPALNARWLPPGSILDSGAPCAFLREGVPDDELFFILGWCLTPLCTRVLKEVLNHTRNVQSKDFERLPYPFWVPAEAKAGAIHSCRELVAGTVRTGRVVNRGDADVRALVDRYAPPAEWCIDVGRDGRG